MWSTIGGQPKNPSTIVVGIDNDVILVIDRTPPFRAMMYKPPLDVPDCRSDHWFGDGRGRMSNTTWDWEGLETIMRLTGRVPDATHADSVGFNLDARNPPYLPSYGMNTLVQDQKSLPGQVLLMDYRKSLIYPRQGNDTKNAPDQTGAPDDFGKYFAPRHLGKANVMLVSGAIKQVSRTAVDPNVGSNFDQLWKSE